jgi:phenylpyruvate tautomerase
MPLLKIETNVTLSDDHRKTLPAALSKIVAETIGKPEQYVMVTLNPASLLMSGKSDQAAFVDVRSIGGLNGEVNRSLAQKVSRLLQESLGIAPDRVYFNFTDVKASNWGWNGSTFG